MGLGAVDKNEYEDKQAVLSSPNEAGIFGKAGAHLWCDVDQARACTWVDLLILRKIVGLVSIF